MTVTKFIIITVFSTTFLTGNAVADNTILVQSTTSTKNSGLYDHILPLVKQDIGVNVNIVAVGTGAAIKNAMNCDGDVLIVHSKDSEENFVRSGFGLYRKDLMYNDFVIIGPENDPAKVKSSDNAFEAFKKIFNERAIFASRGDESGTHKAEIKIWNNLNMSTNDFNGGWYRELGLGMGATLNVAVQMDAYVLSDRATWLAFKNKRQHLILFEGDESLFNQYGIIPVNPNKCPSVKTNLSKIFIDWMLSMEGQNYISSYKKNGQQLFFPN